ncbi:hypothetical protein GQ55_1G303700 [Panicum hallii var. hallii]|uniref:Uncharacterized protein n=1 Tax=Panicum hallii var. hallii TaxID=1504633 RepID=A0A2T7F949_9POAL|nr:hypothetical protein GQ55_1G303700 [Panicum hallii var. hallii]
MVCPANFSSREVNLGFSCVDRLCCNIFKVLSGSLFLSDTLQPVIVYYIFF